MIFSRFVVQLHDLTNEQARHAFICESFFDLGPYGIYRIIDWEPGGWRAQRVPELNGATQLYFGIKAQSLGLER